MAAWLHECKEERVRVRPCLSVAKYSRSTVLRPQITQINTD